MSDRVVHCPFLNRADPRCAGHFSLDRLGVAFDHCFGRYKACANYQELLVERQTRRGDAGGQSLAADCGCVPQVGSLAPVDHAEPADDRSAFSPFHLPVLPRFEPSFGAALAD